MATRQALTPAAVNRAIDAMNRKKNPADRWYVYSADGKYSLIKGDLFYKTARGALMKAFPGAHVYSYAVSANGETYSFAIDKEPRHVIVTRDPDYDLRMKRQRKSNPAVKKTRAVRVVAANPAPTFARDKSVKAPDLPYSVQRWNANVGDWSTLAAFGMVEYATKWARQYARDFPAQTVRVVDRF